MVIQYGVLHNRKTAGTAVKYVISQQKRRTPSLTVHCFEHAMTFPKFVSTHPSAKAIFFVRDPVSRFVSGFYSRLREGRPRYYYPWSSGEKRAFKRFQHPNQLAEALSSLNLLKRYFAWSAMRSIGHVRHRYVAFLGSLAFLEKEAHKIAFIGHQPDFDADLVRLRALLQIDEDIVAPSDETNAHRNPRGTDKYLSDKALRNLKRWYADDFGIYNWCLEKRNELLIGEH